MSSVKAIFPSISIKRKPKGQNQSGIGSTPLQLSSNSSSQNQIFRPLTPETTGRPLSGESASDFKTLEVQLNANSSTFPKEYETSEALESPTSPLPLVEARVTTRSPRPQSRASNHRESLTSLGHDRSGSVNSESSLFSDLIELPMVDQEDIIALTDHVRAFSEALGALKNTFFENSESHDDKPPEVKAHERLGEVLSILKGVLKEYQPLHSTEILAAAGTLINKVRGHNYEESDQVPEEFCECIDQLALAFSGSVSDFLMGDQEAPLSTSRENSRSFDDFADDDEEEDIEDDGDDMDDDQYDDDYRDDRRDFDKKTSAIGDTSAQKAGELDKALFNLEHGVDLTLQRTKVWSKYAKDIATYLERRAHLEMEFTNKLSKLAQATRVSITEDRYLPFQTIYVTSLDQDIEYAENCARTYSSLLSSKFLEPLQHRRTYHEKKRKDLKDLWTKAYKKLNDAIAKLEKAKQSYIQKQQEIEKFKSSTDTKDVDLSSSFTRAQKKKQQDEVRKADDAEEWYKQCVSEANVRQRELLKTKSHVLVELRQLIYQCDQTMKAVTCNFFQLMHSQSTPAPIRFQCLAETSRTYEPGCQFSDFVHDQTESAQPMVEREFLFEPYISSDKQNSRSTSDIARVVSPLNTNRNGLNPPQKVWGAALPDHLSDAESTGSKSAPVTPDGSPISRHKNRVTVPLNDDSSDDESTTEIEKEDQRKVKNRPGQFENCRMSPAAKTHKFKKLRAPSRCRGCDSYVYFNGAECADCALSCHRKCLARIIHRCDKKKGHNHRSSDHNGGRRMTTFGVDFYSHLQATRKDGECVPYIVSSCIEEINNRGLQIKGIYRTSGVKSKVEKVCQVFENNNGPVDLSDIPPHVIAAVLKLYLRQLPEPLLTFKLYPEFIRLAKECPQDYNSNEYKDLVAKLREVVVRMPRANFRTAAKLISHLKRIANNEEENQMSASNLGIVFGPTLLRPRESDSTESVSMSALVDMAHQTKAVELLINNPQIFDNPRVDDPASQDTPVQVFHHEKTDSTSSDVHSARSRDSSSSQTPYIADEGSSDTTHDDTNELIPDNILDHGDEAVDTGVTDKKILGFESGFLDLLAKSNERTEDKGEEYTIPEFLLSEGDKEQHKDTDESFDDSTQGTSGLCTTDDDLGSSKGSLTKENTKTNKSPTGLSPAGEFTLPSSSSMPDIASAMSRSSSGYSLGTSVTFNSEFPDEKFLPDFSDLNEAGPEPETKIPELPEVPGDGNSEYFRPYPKKTVDDSSVPSRTRSRPQGLGFLKRNSDLPGKLSRLGLFPSNAKSSIIENEPSKKMHGDSDNAGSTPRKHPGISEALREMHIVYDPILHNAEQPVKSSTEQAEKQDSTTKEPLEDEHLNQAKETKEWYLAEQENIHELDSTKNTIEFEPTENKELTVTDGFCAVIPVQDNNVVEQEPNISQDNQVEAITEKVQEMDDRFMVALKKLDKHEDFPKHHEDEKAHSIETQQNQCESRNEETTKVDVSDEVREKMRKCPRISVRDRRRHYENVSIDHEQSTETSEPVRKPTSPIGNIDLASRKQFFEEIEKSAKKEPYKKLNEISKKSKSSSLSSSREDLDEVETAPSVSKLNYEKLEKLEHSWSDNAEENGAKIKELGKLTSRKVNISLEETSHHPDVEKVQKKHLQSTNSYPLMQKSPKASRRHRRQFPEEKTQEDREPQFV